MPARRGSPQAPATDADTPLTALQSAAVGAGRLVNPYAVGGKWLGRKAGSPVKLLQPRALRPSAGPHI